MNNRNSMSCFFFDLPCADHIVTAQMLKDNSSVCLMPTVYNSYNTVTYENIKNLIELTLINTAISYRTFN